MIYKFNYRGAKSVSLKANVISIGYEATLHNRERRVAA